MNSKKDKLTFIESLMLVAGAGIGTGILTIPYVASKVGLTGILVAIFLAYIISLITYMYLADLTLNSKDSTQLLGILKEHLFRGRYKKVLTYLFFVIFIVILLQNLIVYIMSATDVISELFNIEPQISKIIFYVVASTLLMFGIKGVGIGEKISVPLISSVVILLIVLSMSDVKSSLNLAFGKPSLVIAVFGLFMFAFSAIFSVVQVTNNIEDIRYIKKALVGGLSINMVLTLLFAIASIVGSEKVTQLATIGLTKTINKTWVTMFCSIFVLCAMLTSYWSSALAFADVVSEELGIGKRKACFISTIPTLVLALILPLSIIEFVQIGAGALSIIVGIIILPAYYNAVKEKDKKLLLGRVAKSKVLIWIVGIFTIVMAISSFIPVD